MAIKQLTLFSSNVRGGGRKATEQCEYIQSLNPDMVASQQVTMKSLPTFREYLTRIGAQYVVDSTANVKDASVLVGPRRYSVLMASQ